MKETELAPLPHQLPPDTLLQNRYRIVRVLGEGGFGITYEGWDETLRMRVAVKEYFPRALVTRHQKASKDITIPNGEPMELFSRGKAAFLNEARTLAQFQQDPSIVSVTNFFEENRTAYIVMEYLDGRDLKNVLEEKGTLPYREAYALLQPIMHSLALLHEHGLIHRDISPSNIRVLSDGTAKLMDFGASRAIDSASDASRSVCLKPGYSPEEQYRSRGEQGPWTDVYALCATLYHMIAGFPPDDSLQRILLDEVKAPSELGVAIPETAQTALMRGLAVQSRDRFQTVQELEAALDPNGTDEPRPATVKKDALPWLNLIPVAGLLGPFEMRRRTGRRRFARIGTVFLIAFCAMCALLLADLALRAAAEIDYVLNAQNAFLYVFRNTGFSRDMRIVSLLLFLFYAARVIYTLVVRRDYARFRSAYLAKNPPKSQTDAERAVDRGIFAWRVVGFVPRIYGCGGLHIAKKSKTRSLALLGGAGIAVSVLLLLSVLMFVEADNLTYPDRWIASIILEYLICAFALAGAILYVLHLVRLQLVYPAFRQAECADRAKAYAAYPNLCNPTWRAENSRWQIWTWFPMLGGIGLILGGRRAKSRALVSKGVWLLILNALSLIVFLRLLDMHGSANWSDRAFLQLIMVPLFVLPFFLWRHTIYLGCSERFAVLRAIAEDLGPDYSRADKEIAEMK